MHPTTRRVGNTTAPASTSNTARSAQHASPMTRAGAMLAGAGTVVGLLVAATPASAHGLVGKQDLPIPRWLFAWAATVVLVVSFVALAVLWRSPRLERA